MFRGEVWFDSNKVKAGFQVLGLCIHAFADKVHVGKKSLQGGTMMWPFKARRHNVRVEELAVSPL